MSIVVLRWIARLSALLVAGGYVFLAVGEILTPHSAPPSTLIEWAGIALLTLTCVGMLIAWRWELPGSVLSLGALIAFAVTVRMTRHAILWVFALPGILFLADWAMRRRFGQAGH